MWREKAVFSTSKSQDGKKGRALLFLFFLIFAGNQKKNLLWDVEAVEAEAVRLPAAETKAIVVPEVATD